MLCDIHFICFGQETPTPPYEVNGVHVVSEMEDVVDAQRYYRIAPFFRIYRASIILCAGGIKPIGTI